MRNIWLAYSACTCLARGGRYDACMGEKSERAVESVRVRECKSERAIESVCACVLANLLDIGLAHGIRLDSVKRINHGYKS